MFKTSAFSLFCPTSLSTFTRSLNLALLRLSIYRSWAQSHYRFSSCIWSRLASHTKHTPSCRDYRMDDSHVHIRNESTAILFSYKHYICSLWQILVATLTYHYLFLVDQRTIVVFSLNQDHLSNDEYSFLIKIVLHHLLDYDLQRLKVEFRHHCSQV